MPALIRPSAAPVAAPAPPPPPGPKKPRSKSYYVSVNLVGFEPGRAFTEDELPEGHHPVEYLVKVGAITCL